jgi:hypothetical protein
VLVVVAAESDASVKRQNLVAATSLVVDVGAEVDTTDGSGLNGGVLGAAFEDLAVTATRKDSTKVVAAVNETSMRLELGP